MTNCNNRPRRGWKVMHIIGMVITGLVFAVIFALAFGYIVQHLWNWLLPDLFGFKAITFLQAFALIILSKILFSGIGHSMGRHAHDRGRGHFGGRFHQGYGGFSGDDRRYFHQYWAEEGKAAFGEYVKRMDKNGCCKPSGNGESEKSS